MKQLFVFIPALLLSASIFGQDSNEPNDEFGEATVIPLEDLTYEGEGFINPDGDEDYYRIEFPRTGLLVVQIVVPSNIYPNLALFNENQEEVKTVQGSQGTTTTFIGKICSAGTYFFRIKDRFRDNSSTEAYRFTATLNIDDDFECNDRFNEASVVTLGDTIVGTVLDEGDEDYYRIEFPRTGLLVAQIVVPSNIYPNLTLFNEDQEEIKTVQGSQGTTTTFVGKICDAGTYYLRVKDRFSDNFSTEIYRLTPVLDTLDVYECNDQFTDAALVELGDTIIGTIQDEGDQDYFRIDVTRTGVLSAQISVPSNLYPNLTLFDEDQVELVSIQGGQGITTTLTNQFCSPGTYYLRVRDRFSDNSSSDAYRLNLDYNSADTYECNDEFATAFKVELCDTIYGTIFPSDDEDFYQISAMAGDTIIFEFGDIQPNIQYYVSGYSEDQNSITLIQENMGDPILLIADESGNYYFQIYAQNSSTFSQDFYSFLLTTPSGCDVTNTTELLSGGTISLSPNPTQHNITVTYGAQLASKQPTLRIFGADGRQLADYPHIQSGRSLDLTGLPTGLLLFQFRAEGEMRTLRVVKEGR